MRHGAARLLILLSAYCSLLANQPARAADWSVVPGLNLGAQYTSNVNLSFDNKKSDVIFNTSPSVDFAYASEITKLTGRLALNGLIYLKGTSLDCLNQFYQISGQHKVAPRLSLTFSGGYSLDSTQSDELTTSGYVMKAISRQSLRAAPGLDFNLTERALLNLGYGFNQVLYQSHQYPDYFQHSVNLGLRYPLKNEKTTLQGTISGRYTSYPSIENSYRNLGTYGGLEHKFSEDWGVSFFAGLNYNWFSSRTAVQDFEDFPFFVQARQVTQQTFTVSPYLSIGTKRSWTKTNFNFGYKIDQSPSAGGSATQSHIGYAILNYFFSEKLTGTLQGNTYYSNASSPGSDYQNLTLSLSPGINYRVTEKLSINSSYSYYWRESVNEGRTTDRHLVWLYLSYSYPIHHQR